MKISAVLLDTQFSNIYISLIYRTVTFKIRFFLNPIYLYEILYESQLSVQKMQMCIDISDIIKRLEQIIILNIL